MHMSLDRGLWEVIEPFAGDDGAYATLYLVRAANGEEAVAKCVKKRPGARRELLIGDLIHASKYSNVVPVIDSGEHAGHFVIVMPRASMSLKQFIDRHPAGVPVDQAMTILADVALALAEIDGDIVHRDLKPANILLHEGAWKLADFGVSRFVDDATATETRRDHFSHPYAAPEQWRHQSPSSQTDVYAFGVIAYELIEGRRPFPGPNFREQHLTDIPAQMAFGTTRTRQLIAECLLKEPQTRPGPRTLRDRLEAAAADVRKPGTAKLADLSARRTQRISIEQARLQAERDERERLETITADATKLLMPVARTIRAELHQGAPEIVFDTVLGNAAPVFRARYDSATLEFDRVDPVEHWEGPFTVFAYSSITIEVRRPDDGWRGRSHSLWYCDALERGRFAWHELGFTSSQGHTGRRKLEPYSAPPWSIEEAFAGTVESTAVAWPVMELDLADSDDFVQRWIGWFADAAAGGVVDPAASAEWSPHANLPGN
ncbi:protein kinase domain-containing protein [Microbacterium trichothecenolyticum]